MHLDNFDRTYLLILKYLLILITEMDGPGTISWDEFLANAESFIIVSDQISDGWKICGNKVIIFN